MSKRLFTVFFGVALLSLASLPHAEAATKSWTGCPVASYYSVDPGPRLSVSWVVTGEPQVISFQADKILLGGGKGMMYPRVFSQWEPYLSELRNAASQKVKVKVFYDDATHTIQGIYTQYDQKC